MTTARRFALLLGSAALAALACSRSSVPIEAGLGSGQAEAAPAPTDIPAPATQPIPTALPTSTPAPTAVQLEPLASPTFPPTPTTVAETTESILYRARPGDYLRSLAVRFGVLPSDIITPDGDLPAETELLAPDQILFIPRRLGPTGPADEMIPDSELVYSPHAVDFDIERFVAEQGGYLNQYTEIVGGRRHRGAQIVELAARDHSMNPRLLLALLEFHSGWVTDPTSPEGDDFDFPLGHLAPETQGLYRQLAWLSDELGIGYYGWRSGSLTEFVFPDSSIVRIAPSLNAGTVALQRYFAWWEAGRSWAEVVSPQGFIGTYQSLFGDAFDYEHPLYEANLQQPELILPFFVGRTWAYTGGPHGAWNRESAWAALDFAPSTLEGGCSKTDDWALAAAPGLVVRAGDGVVVLDLDGDGLEQTGWSLLYLHIGRNQPVQAGDLVNTGDLIGQPSCVGGVSTGTHVHLARKYNGEWILADGPLPFTLSGWVAKAGTSAYQGALIKGERTVLACTCASRATYIER